MLRVIVCFILSTATWLETVESNVVMTYGKDGYLSNDQPTQILSPSDRFSYFESFGYPKAPFKKLRQSWSWTSISEIADAKTAVKIICSDIRFLPGTCDESSLKLKDGDEEIVYCGDKAAPFTIISKNKELSAFLTVGPKGQVYLKCTAKAVHLNSNREELTTSRPSYLVDESEEVDSEEHGGAEGDKTTTCPCGWANKMSSRIINGSVTNPNEFPFVAALVEKYDQWQFCGATIITTWHALTAAHCTFGWRERDPLALLVGQHNIYDGTMKGSQMIDVMNIVEHEGYSPELYVYDISLLVLKREIVLSAKVGPACLPTQQYNLSKKYVKVIGVIETY